MGSAQTMLLTLKKKERESTQVDSLSFSIFPIKFFREGDLIVVLIFQSTSQKYSPYPSFSISAFGMKRKDAEFMQYLKPVGLGPS